jgi:hypothetical protein
MTDRNHTVKQHLMQSVSNITKNIKIYIVLYFSIMLISCSSINPQKPDNKLKKSPCACSGVIYDSRVSV